MQEEKFNCPKCDSHNVEAKQRGFSGSNAAVGGWLFGGLGFLVAGYNGSNDVIAKCFNCSHEWNHNQRLGFDFKSFKRSFYNLYEQKEFDKAKQFYLVNSEFDEAIPDIHVAYLRLKQDDRRSLFVGIGFAFFIALCLLFMIIGN